MKGGGGGGGGGELVGYTGWPRKNATTLIVNKNRINKLIKRNRFLFLLCEKLIF